MVCFNHDEKLEGLCSQSQIFNGYKERGCAISLILSGHKISPQKIGYVGELQVVMEHIIYCLS